jgi:MFS family permease
MNAPDIAPALPASKDDGTPWWRLLNRYHWFVFIVATLGWLFDTMDQQLFNIARTPAVRELAPDSVAIYSGYATSIFLIGWGTGGLIFGVLGDLIGRARSMVLTILLYSLFTGLSALSVGFWDFALYRFLTGLGVGGQFAVGVSLVAEVMPERARTPALGLLQALSAVGNITAAIFGIVLAFLGRAGTIEGKEAWRYMFVIGTVPALLVLVIMRRLKEPERWQALAGTATVRERLRAYTGELFADPRWSRNAIIGLLLASSGIIGLWAIGFFSIDLVREIIRPRLVAEGLSKSDVTFWEDIWASLTSVMLNIGAFFGIYTFSKVTGRFGRRPTFAVAFILALGSTALVFGLLNSFGDLFWMIPLMGFCQLALFGGYAIYFPELFPTRLRSTGISFCYNGARFVAATGPLVQGFLRDYFRDLAGGDVVQGFRTAGLAMCSIFLIGLIVLPFAPETRGQPLPE